MEIIALQNIRSSFEDLIENQAQNTRQIIEDKKLLLIQELYDKLLARIEIAEHINTDPCQSECPESYLYWIYNSLMISSLFKHSLSSFLFGVTLLELIPGISHLASIVISIIYTCLDSVIFYAIEIAYLKRALHIEDNYDAVCELLDNYRKQLKLIQFMNQELSSFLSLQLTKEEYNAYYECLKCMNEDLEKKLSEIHEYPESTWKMVIKYFMISIGTLSKIAASYFIAKSLLTALAAFLIGTPWGCLFISVIVFGGTGFFYALGEHSVTRLMYPEMEFFKQLTQDYATFKKEKPKNQKANEVVINFFSKSSHNAETQTSELSLSYKSCSPLLTR